MNAGGFLIDNGYGNDGFERGKQLMAGLNLQNF